MKTARVNLSIWTLAAALAIVVGCGKTSEPMPRDRSSTPQTPATYPAPESARTDIPRPIATEPTRGISERIEKLAKRLDTLKERIDIQREVYRMTANLLLQDIAEKKDRGISQRSLDERVRRIQDMVSLHQSLVTGLDQINTANGSAALLAVVEMESLVERYDREHPIP